MDTITSRRNPLVRAAAALLGSPRERRERREFLCEGARLCRDAAESGVRIKAWFFTPRAGERYGEYLKPILHESEAAYTIEDPVAGLLSDTCVLQLLIALNRDLLEAPAEPDDVTYRFDPKMEEVTRYIRDHLGEELTIERLSGAFFLSRYYLMHRFKAVYGCTVHQYIRQKRLQRAAGDIRRGVPILKAAGDAGFGDYSVFLRAFRSAYGRSPREWK